MKILLAALLLMSVSGSLYAQGDCRGFNGTPNPEPYIAPQPGGWTFQPGNGEPIMLGAVPFPTPAKVPGSVVVQYVSTHNNPGNTCNWKGKVTEIMFIVLSYSDAAGTQDERSDSFTYPFNTDQSQTYTFELDNRYIKKLDLVARNAAGWSGFSNSFYSSPQHTGIKLSTLSAKSEGLEWRLCVVPN